MQQDLVDLAFLSINEESHHQHHPPLQPLQPRSDHLLSAAAAAAATTDPATMKEHTGAGAGAAADDAAAQCPVDHKSREAWLSQARAAQGDVPPHPHPHPNYSAAQTPQPSSQNAASTSSSWGGWRIPFFGSSSSSSPSVPPPNLPSTTAASPLGTQREVSSIPRSSTPGDSTCPVNHEVETGSDEKSGNWIYPSEKMFFDAMKRKGHGAEAADMRTVVPIHNAVNEKAWAEIREWERPYEKDGSCPGGPRLHSFTGLSSNMSPKARLNTLLGYTAPFDRHDWVVDRCGTKVDYVIDFYAGSSKAGGGRAQGKVSFYLDVRPKLNSWEGVKMRAARALGIN